MKNLYYFIIIFLFISSCSPEATRHRQEQKIARFLKKNPQLINQDTIKKEIDIDVPQICDTARIVLKSDSSKIDSLTNRFKDKVDSVTLDSLEYGFKDILKHSGDIDTLIKAKKSTFRIKKKGNDLTVEVVTNPSKIKVIIPVSITTIQVHEIELKWYEKAFKWIRETAGMIGFSFLFLLILYVIYRVVKRFFIG